MGHSSGKGDDNVRVRGHVRPRTWSRSAGRLERSEGCSLTLRHPPGLKVGSLRHIMSSTWGGQEGHALYLMLSVWHQLPLVQGVGGMLWAPCGPRPNLAELASCDPQLPPMEGRVTGRGVSWAASSMLLAAGSLTFFVCGCPESLFNGGTGTCHFST